MVGALINYFKKNLDPNVTDEEIEELFNKLQNDGIQLHEIEIKKRKLNKKF